MGSTLSKANDSMADDAQPPAPAFVPPGQPTCPGALFRLPLELRREIYQHLLPSRKVVRPRASYNYPGHPKQWTFYLEDTVKQPLLTQLCAETRNFMLQKGIFIFKKGDTEGGLWWDPEKDVLIFDRKFHAYYSAFALDGLQGLENVKNIGLDSQQAKHMHLRCWYRTTVGVQESRFFLTTVMFIFQDTSLPADNDGNMHFISKYFDHVRKLYITFDELFPYPQGCVFDDPRYSVCFNLCKRRADMDEVRQGLEHYNMLWTAKCDMDPTTVPGFAWNEPYGELDYHTEDGLLYAGNLIEGMIEGTTGVEWGTGRDDFRAYDDLCEGPDLPDLTCFTGSWP